jgi:AcrR family transcriptional regulator
MKAAIVRASRDLLARKGLGGWTIEEVARHTPCAKGLVLYHFKTKTGLLTATAEVIREERMNRRWNALKQEGTAALDALWAVLMGEVRSGEFAAWIALSAVPEEPIHLALRTNPADLQRLQAAIGRSLGISDAHTGELLESVLAGFQTALLHDHDASLVRDAYHHFWLGLIQ